MPRDDTVLFDRALLRQRRERVRQQFADCDYLYRRAAEDLLDRLDVVLRDFPLALDLGAGHGLLADRLAARDRIGTVVAADLSADLVAGIEGVPRFVCDEEWLPLKEGSVNLVTSLWSLQFVNDLPGALIQIRRALAPDGLFMAAVPGGRTLSELATSFMLAEEELSGGVSPRVAPMADLRDYGALLQRAGFALPVVDSDLVTVTFDNPLTLMRELRHMGAGNILMGRLRRPMTRSLLFRVGEIYMERFGVNGRVPATFEIVHLLGWAPHESQPQPLAPGSATTSLASVLSVCPTPDADNGDESNGQG